MKYVLALCAMCIGISVLSQSVLVVKAAQATGSPKKTPSTQAPAATPAPPPQAAPAVEDFVIGPEDVLQISVWREPDLAAKAVVRPDGKIGIPLLNDVQASGLTTKQLQDRLTAGLGRFVSEPSVSVIVTEIHSQMVHVIGAVARPGAYVLGGPLTIVELLARAGGLSEFAKSQEIAIVRSEGGRSRRWSFNYRAFVEGRDLQQNVLLRSGDVIVVP